MHAIDVIFVQSFYKLYVKSVYYDYNKSLKPRVYKEGKNIHNNINGLKVKEIRNVRLS